MPELLINKYKRMIRSKMTISEIARKRGVSRQAVSSYFKKHKLEPFRPPPAALNTVAERIEYHLECAKNMQELLNYLIQKQELYSLGVAQKSISKFLREKGVLK
jgi:predicted transcriptional regulator